MKSHEVRWKTKGHFPRPVNVNGPFICMEFFLYFWRHIDDLEGLK